MIERLFYRLPELANRWGCAVDDLLHLGIQDRAQICANIYGYARDIHMVRIETEAPPDDPHDTPKSEEEVREAQHYNVAHDRWKARTTREMPFGIYELEQDTLRFLDMPDAFPFQLESGLRFDHRGWWEVSFEEPVPMGIENLCVLHEEFLRLDREEFGRGPVARDTGNEPTGKAKNTLLRLVGGLLMSGHGMNIHAERLSGISDVLNDLAQVGVTMDDKTLRSWIKEAAQVIEPPKGDMKS